MAYWIVVEQDGPNWCNARRYLPGVPFQISRKGFAVLCVEFGSHMLRLSSAAQLKQYARVLSMRLMPM